MESLVLENQPVSVYEYYTYGKEFSKTCNDHLKDIDWPTACWSKVRKHIPILRGTPQHRLALFVGFFECMDYEGQISLLSTLSSLMCMNTPAPGRILDKAVGVPLEIEHLTLEDDQHEPAAYWASHFKAVYEKHYGEFPTGEEAIEEAEGHEGWSEEHMDVLFLSTREREVYEMGYASGLGYAGCFHSQRIPEPLTAEHSLIALIGHVQAITDHRPGALCLRYRASEMFDIPATEEAVRIKLRINYPASALIQPLTLLEFLLEEYKRLYTAKEEHEPAWKEWVESYDGRGLQGFLPYFLESVDAVLAGDLEQLGGVYSWASLPQGHEHWYARYWKEVPLSSDDIEFLQALKARFETLIKESPARA